jgi:DNA-directed RNA polymerase subunit RPC12/RpoP
MDWRKCYQCGRSDPTIAEDDPDWLVCGYCGSRLISAKEFLDDIEKEKEERIKRALGFDKFKPSGE